MMVAMIMIMMLKIMRKTMIIMMMMKMMMIMWNVCNHDKTVSSVSINDGFKPE